MSTPTIDPAEAPAKTDPAYWSKPENQPTPPEGSRPPVLILYHAHCADGFASATVAWLVFGPSATYLPVQYQQPLPEIPDGAEVFMLDFSAPREQLTALKERCLAVHVIDHHKSAEANLRGLTNCLFDLTKSGAVLTWEWFREHRPEIIFGEVPELLRYVQDRDLWTWELRESRAVSAALAARDRSFAEWQDLIRHGKAGLAQLMCEGRYILRAQEQLVQSITARRWFELAKFPDAAGVLHGIPVVNTPVLISEACHRLLELHPDAPWVASYFDQEGQPGEPRQRVWSLRSRPGGADVSEIAARLGGGGHAQAAGFTEVLP